MTSTTDQLESTTRVELLRRMVRIRVVEEEISRRYSDQQMRCPVHLSVGQEAAAVGACAPLQAADQIVTTHRCHGHYLAKGGDLTAMLAEIHGKATGCCGGRGGSMHLRDDDAGVLASIPIVGSNIPLAVGAALAMHQRRSGQVAVAFFGDAAIEEGVFHESANFASLHRLPVIFVVENNLYSVYTRLSDRQPPSDLTRFGAAHAMPAYHGDGNNVEVVCELMRNAVAQARDGSGPSLLVFDTYRLREHCGPNYDDTLGYRPAEEVEHWKQRCPITGYRNQLVATNVLTASEFDAIRESALVETTAAFKAAIAAPFPTPDSADDAVYARRAAHPAGVSHA